MIVVNPGLVRLRLNSRPYMFVLLDPYIRDSTFSLNLGLSLNDMQFLHVL